MLSERVVQDVVYALLEMGPELSVLREAKGKPAKENKAQDKGEDDTEIDDGSVDTEATSLQMLDEEEGAMNIEEAMEGAKD